jgi:hypothetical protein
VDEPSIEMHSDIMNNSTYSYSSSMTSSRRLKLTFRQSLQKVELHIEGYENTSFSERQSLNGVDMSLNTSINTSFAGEKKFRTIQAKDK